MRNLTVILLAAIVALGALPPSATAKSLRKMDTEELLQVIREHSRVSKRIEAIDELVARGSIEAVPELAGRCQQDPNPDICSQVVSGLAQLNHPDAREQLLVILRQVGAPEDQRNQALSELLISDKDRLRQAMPAILSDYRSLPPAVGESVIRALITLSQEELGDLAILITRDPDAHRDHRIAALAVVEHFAPARRWEAWIGMLNDPDSRVRAHSAKMLGQEGLPASVVHEVLLRVYKNDVEGNVRAAAARSLAYFANETLLPDLHEALISERHPVAWDATLQLLLPLADSSSVSALVQLLERDRARRIKPEVLTTIVRKLAFIGDARIVPNIYAIEQNHQGSEFAEVCRRATTALKAEDVERELALQQVQRDPEINVVMWDPDSPDATFPPLQFERAPNGQVLPVAQP